LNLDFFTKGGRDNAQQTARPAAEEQISGLADGLQVHFQHGWKSLERDDEMWLRKT